MPPPLTTPHAEAERLAELRRYGVLGTPPEEAFTRFIRVAQAAFGVSGVLLSFLGEKRVYFKAQLGVAARSYPRRQALCTRAALGDAPLVVADAQAVPELAALSFVRQNDVRFYAGVPLRAPSGAVLGALSVFDLVPRELSPGELQPLVDLTAAIQEVLEVRRWGLTGAGGGAQLTDAQHERFTELLERAPYYGVSARADGTLLHVNRALEALWEPQALPRTIFELYPEREREPLTAALREAQEPGSSRLETFLSVPNGAPVPVVQDIIGHSQGGVSVLARDLSAERQREAFEGRRAEVLELTARGAPLPAVLLHLTSFLEAYCAGMIAAVSRLDEGRLQLEVAPHLPGAFARVLDGLLVGPEAGACGAAAHTGVRTITPDIRRDPRWHTLRYFALQHGLQACWSEPVLSDQGEVLGTVALYADSVRNPTDLELRTLREAAQLAAIAISRGQLYRQLEHQAHYDALTGLPNRRLLLEHLGRALGHAEHYGALLGVLMLDLDNFKEVNDSLGHSAGDLLLCEVAERLQGCLPPGASVARSGGDEFVFIVPLSHRDDAARFASDITGALRAPFVVQGRTFRIGASIGISLYPEHALELETLLKTADSAMYAAKADAGVPSRQGYRLYQSAMTDELELQLRLEAELRRALAGDELRLFVQPRFELAAQRIGAFEALVRWQHPEGELLAPAAFLGVAQKAGLLPQLDAWVLRGVIEQLSRWRAAGKTERLSCNVSAASFQSGSFLEELADSLGRYGVPAAQLELEITEHLLMQDLEGAAAQLRELKARFPGVRVAIDDFGSGYSSLAYLRYLPIDTLKIDRAFVKDLDHSDAQVQRTALAVIRTVIALGRDLGFRVVAEGAETEGHLGMLTALGVDEVQGYVLGKPQPLSEVVVDVRTDAGWSAEQR